MIFLLLVVWPTEGYLISFCGFIWFWSCICFILSLFFMVLGLFTSGAMAYTLFLSLRIWLGFILSFPWDCCEDLLWASACAWIGIDDFLANGCCLFGRFFVDDLEVLATLLLVRCVNAIFDPAFNFVFFFVNFCILLVNYWTLLGFILGTESQREIGLDIEDVAFARVVLGAPALLVGLSPVLSLD